MSVQLNEADLKKIDDVVMLVGDQPKVGDEPFLLNDHQSSDISSVQKQQNIDVKEPRYLKDVYAQVKNHPEFSTKLSAGTQFAFWAAFNGWSRTQKENSKWVRSVWRHLFQNQPLNS